MQGPHVRQLGAYVATVVVVSALMLALVFATGGKPAQAQLICQAGTTFEVDTAAELDAAIGCLNSEDAASGDYEIRLGSEIDVTAALPAPIDQARPGFSLTIDGQGNRIVDREPPGLGPPGVIRAVIEMSPANRVPVVIEDIELEAELRATSDYLVWSRSSARLEIRRSALRHIPGSAVISEGTGNLTIQDSYLQSGDLTIGQAGGQVEITSSTVASIPDGVGVGVNLPLAGMVTVDNSTFIDSAILVGDSPGSGTTAIVRNSTIQGAAPGGNGSITVQSSIVDSCPSTPLIDDAGNNVGGCFGTPVTLGPAASLDCAVPTPIGCPPVVAIGPNSPAVGAGDCTDVLADQRGEARTPAGRWCDAGAFETGCTASPSVVVLSLQQFNAALACLNSDIAPPGDYEIRVRDNIDVTTTPLLPINQNRAGFTLTIDGGGNRILDREQPGLNQRDAAGDAILEMSPPNLASVLIENLELEAELRAASDYLVWNRSPARLQLRRSALRHIPGSAVVSDGTGNLTIQDSYLQSGDLTIGQAVGDVEITSSTVASIADGVGVGVNLPLAGTLTVDNSTFIDSAILVGDSPGSGSTAIVRNSTIQGAAPGGNGSITVQSSIVDACPFSTLIDGGNNVGECFGTPVTLGPAEGVECIAQTPIGCPPVIAIAATSPAIGAGDCTGVPADQHGKPRTPVGPGCDAGAYESECAANTSLNAATELEFALAITCLNAPSTVARVLTINLLNDIEARTVSGSSVFPELAPVVDTTLRINGNAFTLRRSGDGPSTPADMLSLVAEDVQLVVTLDLVNLEVGPADQSGINLAGDDVSFFLQRSSISAATTGTAATGIVSTLSPTGFEAGDLHVLDSKIDGVRVGLSAGTLGSTLVQWSSISATEKALVADDGLAEVFSSTLVAPIAIEALAIGSVSVANSTVIGDGAAIPDPDFAASIVYRSSIATVCSGFVVDAGNNIGDCFAPGSTVDTELGDNGCGLDTPTGCPLTVALSPAASALGQGDCSSYDGNDFSTDQRRVARTPVGPGCDAGAFESALGILGDVNDDGRIDVFDAKDLLDWLAGGSEPARLAAGDVTGDGEVKLDDALVIAQLVAG